MRRFRCSIYDYDEGEIIEAISEEAAIASFRELMEDDITDEQSDIYIQEIGQKEHRHGPRPICCDDINKLDFLDEKPPVNLLAYDVDYANDNLIERPHWRLNKLGLEIRYCPFCGSTLPEVEKKKVIPTPIWTPGGSRCGTCDVVNGHGWCECNPAEAAYRIV